MIRMCKSAIFLLAFLVHGLVYATNSVMSGFFDGSEPTTTNLPGTCSETSQLGYQHVSGVQVSVSGNYTVVDVYDVTHGIDISAPIYRNSFNPNSPETNLVTPFGVDVSEEVTLTAGEQYVLVVQHWCSSRDGTWAVSFSGPGSVSAESIVTVPNHTMGSFSDADPMANTNCGDSQYQQSDAVQVSRSGRYYYNDVSIRFAVDMCLAIYSAPFNSANPSANLVAGFDDFGSVELEAGRNYYFVVQPLDTATTGEYFYVLSPPAPFRINTAMSGSWFNPETTGQGFFMDILDSSNQLFLAWFTYDLERPDSSVSAMIGEPGHRWMTALGPFEGVTADLPIYWNSGMIFDSATPLTEQMQDGDMTVRFTDCANGNVEYDLGSTNVTGNVPIQRLANDAVSLCNSLFEGPDSPGPL